MCFYNDESCDVWRVTHPRARKPHRCYECFADIPVGAVHELITSLFDGDWSRTRTCLACVSLRDAVIAHEEADGCFGSEAVPPTGEVWSAAWDVGVVVPRERWADARATFAAESQP